MIAVTKDIAKFERPWGTPKAKLETARRAIEADPLVRATHWETPDRGYIAQLVVECGCEPDCDQVSVMRFRSPGVPA